MSRRLDVQDISAPGHTLAEPGGLDYRRVHAGLDQIARRQRFVGFDAVELNPAPDAGEVTARTHDRDKELLISTPLASQCAVSH